ncbi:Ig-like domain-containing protein [Massilia sp. SM-13]|uniref:Ig-like domain-containing protein n=1 Tax=Pseudoduganella rhizocola TaxID=3382643 RepID=UPI0038B4DE1D
MPADFPPKSSLTVTTPSGPLTTSGDIAFEFSGAIHAGSGKITITDGITQTYTGRDGSLHTRIVGASDTRVIDIGSPEVSINGSTLTINPSENLKLGLDYHVVIDAGAVLDTGNATFTGLAQTGGYHFTPVIPVDLTISFEWDSGVSNSDLVTNEGWQTIYIDLSEEPLATDRVEVFVNGSWVTAHREEDEGPDYFWVNAELNGTGAITARLVSGSDAVKGSQTNTFVIDYTAPEWDPYNAALSLNIGSDTGDTGDGATQYTDVVIDVDLHDMSGLQAGDIISLRDLYYDGYEGYELGPQRGASHVVTAADLAGYGKLSFHLSFDPDHDFGESTDGHFPLTVAVSDVAGNLRHSNDIMDLRIDRSSAYFEGMETSSDLTKLYLHFSEVVRPAGFKLINLDNNSEITITPAMMAEVPETSTLQVTLTAALADGAHYRLESLGFLYDTAGNITTTHPLVADTIVHFGLDAVLHTIVISNDSGTADGVTNVAAQTFSGSFDGALYAGQFIEVSLDGGSSWTVAHVSGTTWSLDATLTSGDHLVVARVHTPTGYGEEIHTNVVYQTTAPTLGSPPEMEAADDHGIADGITNATSITVTPMISAPDIPTLHVGDRIELINASATVLGSHTLTASDFENGTLNQGISITPGLGTHQISTRIVDGAGNVGNPSSYFTVTIDNTAPGLGSAPDLLSSSDDGASNSDNITTNTNLTVRALLATESGYRAGDVVNIVHENGDVLGAHTITASDFDSYGNIDDIDIALTTLAEGSHKLHVRVSDVAGNTAESPTLTVTVVPDTDPPTAVLDMDVLTFNTSTGLVEARLDGDITGTRIQFSVNGGGTWLEGNQSGDYWSFISPYGPFSVLQMRVVDSAGNIGDAISGVSGSSVVTVVSEYNDGTSTSGGQSVLFTRGGDDSIALSDPFSYIDGGSGTDALVVMGNTAANASDWAGKVHNIERIDLADTSSLSVLSSAAVFGLGITSLRIDGSAANSVNIGNLAWLATGSSGGYHSYTANNITLEIADAITLVGTPDYGA